jgi:hypothetical protein
MVIQGSRQRHHIDAGHMTPLSYRTEDPGSLLSPSTPARRSASESMAEPNISPLSKDADLKLMFQRQPSPRQTENRLAPFHPPEYSSKHPRTAPGSSERTLRQERLESVSCEIEWPVACRRPDKQQMEAEQYAEAAEAAETAAGKPKVGFPANWHFRFLLSSAVHPIRFWLFCERARG